MIRSNCSGLYLPVTFRNGECAAMRGDVIGVVCLRRYGSKLQYGTMLSFDSLKCKIQCDQLQAAE